jgi:hypothetical protein
MVKYCLYILYIHTYVLESCSGGRLAHAPWPHNNLLHLQVGAGRNFQKRWKLSRPRAGKWLHGLRAKNNPECFRG